MDDDTNGLTLPDTDACAVPNVPWARPGFSVRGQDPKTNPETGGGRRMIHPYLADIVYPENPSQTLGFDWDAMRTMKSVLTKTQGGSAIAKYPDFRDDVVITEIFDGTGSPNSQSVQNQTLAVSIEFFRLLWNYLITPLPVGDYLGWQPRDLSPYCYFIELIDVKLGTADQYRVEEYGSSEPYFLVDPMTVTFKLIQPAQSPAGVLTFVGH